MQSTPHESAAVGGEIPELIAIDSSTPRSRLDELPFELRKMIVNFTLLPMRAVLAHVPQFRIPSDVVLRARKLLCEWAAEHGYLELLKWAHPRDFPLLQVRDGKGACKAAAKGGHLAVLQWLREIRCRWDDETPVFAAAGGHLEVLQWARERGCPWNRRPPSSAAEGGHLAVLQWLRANGCEWSRAVTRAAAEKGHFEVLQWALANGCELAPEAAFAGICGSRDLRIVQWAIGQRLQSTFVFYGPGLTLEVLRYLKEQRPNLAEEFLSLKVFATRQLARVGDLAGLQWARENGYFDPDQVYLAAAEGGQLEVLKWAHQNRFPSLTASCDPLLRGGHLECLKWAVANGARLSEISCAAAAQVGLLSVLQWLRNEIRCEWGSDTLTSALNGGHWEVFDWARQRGCPVDSWVCWSALKGGYAEALQWAFESFDGPIILTPEWCEFAANTQVLKVLRDLGCEWNEAVCLAYVRRGDLEMLQWAVRNGCPWHMRTAEEAFQHNNLYILKWAVENGCPMDKATQRKWSEFDFEGQFL